MDHVPEHGHCLRCGQVMGDGREQTPCGEADTIPAPSSEEGTEYVVPAKHAIYQPEEPAASDE